MKNHTSLLLIIATLFLSLTVAFLMYMFLWKEKETFVDRFTPELLTPELPR